MRNVFMDKRSLGLVAFAMLLLAACTKVGRNPAASALSKSVFTGGVTAEAMARFSSGEGRTYGAAEEAPLECESDGTTQEIVDIELPRICTWHGEPWRFYMQATHPILTIETGPLPFWYDPEIIEACKVDPNVGVISPVYQVGGVWDTSYTSHPAEVTQGLAVVEPVFSVYSEGGACDVPLLRCHYPGGDFLSTDLACEGYSVRENLGQICRWQASRTVPLYRLRSGGIHRVVASSVEATQMMGGGWVNEGILGYAPEAPEGTKNRVVLTHLDLTGFEMMDSKYTARVLLDFMPLQKLYPYDWKQRPLRMRVCDDVQGKGSCDYAPQALTISPVSLYFFAGDVPAVLRQEIFHWQIPAYHPEYYSALPSFCERLISPLVLSLNGNPVKLTGAKQGGVAFDLDGTGKAMATGWTADSETAFLVRDLNGNGRVDSGRELFGSATKLRDGSEAANGFEALKHWANLPEGGELTSRNALWSELRLWVDANRNGLSEPAELSTLDAMQLESIDLNYTEVSETDAFGNQTRQRALFTRRVAGQLLESVILDVWFSTLVSY